MSCNPVEEEIRLLTHTVAHMKKDHPLYPYVKKQLTDKLQLVEGEGYAI